MGKTRIDRDTPTTRALRILAHVVQQTKPIAMTEIATALCLPLPTVHRMVLHLEEEGYLRRALGSKRLLAGPQLARVGLHATVAHFQDAPYHAILQSLAEDVGEHCAVGIVYENEVVYVDSVQIDRIAGLGGLRFEPGRRAPLHCTSTGKLFLAYLPDDARQRLLQVIRLHRYTPTTIADKSLLLKELALVRTRGWAATNEEYLPGVVGCSVPVLASRQHFIAGLSFTAPAARMPFTEVEHHVAALQAAAASLSALCLEVTTGDEASADP